MSEEVLLGTYHNTFRCLSRGCPSRESTSSRHRPSTFPTDTTPKPPNRHGSTPPSQHSLSPTSTPPASPSSNSNHTFLTRHLVPSRRIRPTINFISVLLCSCQLSIKLTFLPSSYCVFIASPFFFYFLLWRGAQLENSLQRILSLRSCAFSVTNPLLFVSSST